MRKDVILFILLLLTAARLHALDKNNFACSKGVLDARKYDCHSKEPLELSGEWFFQYKAFADSAGLVRKNDFINVPGTWDKYSQNGWFTKNLGYATYGLKILLPQGQSSWALRTFVINSAYKLYINGKLVAEEGQTAQGPEMVPGASSRVVYFTAPAGEAFILLHVSNYHTVTGGMWAPMELGTADTIATQREKSFLLSAFLFGCLVIMGLYHFGLFLFRKKDKGPLYFAITCIFLAIRELLSKEAYLFYFFPSFDYTISFRILYLVFPMVLYTFVHFIYSLYQPLYSNVMKQIAVVVAILYALMVVLLPAYIYGQFLILVIAVFCLQVIYMVYIFIRAGRNRYEGNLIILSGSFILLAAIVNDLLYEAGTINTTFLLPFGFFIFILCQSLLLAKRFSASFTRTELLTEELMVANKAFEQMSLRRQKAEEQKALEEVKNRFFANITHELRTPLTLIISPVETLLKGSYDTVKASAVLQTISRNAHHLLRLINQLLEYSKLQSGGAAADQSVGNIDKFVKEMADLFRIMAEAKNIEMVYHGIPYKEDLLFDSDKLEKIVFNLLSNAFKYTPSGGRVSVSLECKESEGEFVRVTITVEDTGIGIPKDKLPSIFDRFYQVENSGNNYMTGSGIGLALVKELTDLLQGKTEVKSEPGKGSVFKVELPLAKAAGKTPTVPEDDRPSADIVHEDYIPPAVTEKGAAGSRELPLIVIIEDNKELCYFIAEGLKDRYRLLTAHDGLEGWELVQSELPEVVICDIMLPTMDGYSIGERIKTTSATNHIGLIFLTAKTAPDSKIKALLTGANDYITKPFHYNELLARIDNLLAYQKTLRDFYQKNLIHPGEGSEKPATEEENPFLTKLYRILESELSNSELSVPFIAEELGMSTRTLNRKLSTLAGMSATELIRSFRLQRATELLKKGHNVSEVAYLVGFESPSYFGQCFKEVYKVTPSEY